ncbi:MAG: hypothetical protein J5611_03075 [Alphaproteobacteria bacterium]|nr:hypothetical protein [Alphaproteobacteria bacterium]
MFVCEKRRISAFLIGLFVIGGSSFAAPSVRQLTDSGNTTTTYANPTTVRSGVLPAAKATTTVSRLPAMPQPIKPTTPTTVGTGNIKVGGTSKVSNKNMGTVLLDNLQQQIDVLRDYYESLPTRDEIDAIETALESDYAKKDDFNNLQFAVRDDNVKYSIDEGKTWNTVAPISTFAGKDGCAPTIVSTEDASNKRVILGINNCSDYTEVTYIPFGQDGAPGAPGKDGQDACVPHFTSSKTDGVTTVTYSCGDTSNTFAISDGKDAELTVQDITRFNLLTADNVADNTIIKNISSKIQNMEDNNADLIKIRNTLEHVSNNWQDINETINMLDNK